MPSSSVYVDVILVVLVTIIFTGEPQHQADAKRLEAFFELSA